MRALPLLLSLLATACATPGPTPQATPEVVVEAPDRVTFNRLARHLDIPMFQRADGKIVRYASTSPWIGDAGSATAEITAYAASGPSNEGLSETEATRRALVRADLDGGRTTLLESDFSEDTPAVRAFLGHMLKTAEIIERLHGHQKGVTALYDQLPDNTPASRALFERNQEPWCIRASEGEVPCAALPGDPPRVFGLYPADIQADADFCATIEAEHGDLLTPFTTVVRVDGELASIPYTEAWADDMGEVSELLKAAALAIAPEGEEALVAYLNTAAEAFVNNDWFAADVAWAAMNQKNSRWYLRVAPDETYFEPCGIHAGFALLLAEIDPGGLAWQDRFEPVKSDMEGALAALAGPPYVARTVGFDLPEFIRVVRNSGDNRSPYGATIGQSLPNWGPVSDAGGRTVAMTNIGTDPDSVAATRAVYSSLLCPEAMALVTDDPEPLLVSTLLHEAAHNLGPSGDYMVDGKNDTESFGGSMSSMLEELKAQTSALYLTDWLVERQILSNELGEKMHAADVTWALGQMSRGMYTASDSWRAYGQLAMIQVGYLTDQGALTWHADATAANGTDTGCLSIDAAKMPAAIDSLAHEVLGLKSRGDRAAAEALKATYVDAEGQWGELREVVTERFGRSPQGSYVYRVGL
jgi:hypothetical protein